MTAVTRSGRALRPESSFFAAALCLAAAGCDDPLIDVQQVDGLRVLGARIEVDGDPARATPHPGEAATVRWLVAPSSSGEGASFTFAACLSTPDRAGVRRCTDAPFAEAASLEPALAAPEIRFTVPEATPPGTDGLSVVGAICERALPAGDADRASCGVRDGGDRVLFDFDVTAGGGDDDDDDNRNPTLGADAIRLSGATWPSTAEPPPEACTGAGLPELRAGSNGVDVRVAVPGSDAEPIPQESGAELPEEALLFAHFSDAGKLERAFSSPVADGDSLAVTVRFDPPDTAPEGGSLARLYFVVRDGRGGEDFAVRSLCIVP